MLKAYCFVLSVLVALPAAAVAQPAVIAPADPAEMTEANAILSIMYPPAEREATFEKIARSVNEQMRASLGFGRVDDPGLNAIVDDAINKGLELQRPVLRKHLPAYFTAIAEAYTHEFNLDELKSIRAFANTPGGRHFLARGPALLSDPSFTKASVALMTEAQAKTEPLLKDLSQKVQAYLKAHPDVAEAAKAKKAN